MHVEERKGYVKIHFFSDEALNAFYESDDRVEYLSDELYSKSLFSKKEFKHFDEYVKENEYVMLYFKNELVAIYRYQNKDLKHIKAKPISNDYFGKVNPRNPEQ